jgi:gliding motility-associated-like protein
VIGYNYPNLKSWYNPNNLSPDAFLPCMDSLFPYTLNGAKRHTGFNRVGIITHDVFNSTDGGEYIANKFIDTLNQGINYCFDLYVIPAKNFKYGMDRLGIYFGTQYQFYNNTLLPVTPQLTTPVGTYINDTSKWSHFELVYTAGGNETDIVIGNFYNYNNTNTQIIDTSFNANKMAYIVIDDVSLHEMAINSGNDAVTCPQNMVATIGETNLDTAFKSYYWYDASGVLIDSINSQIQVQPANNTYYVQEKRMCGQSLWDTVYVQVDTVCPPPPPEPPIVETEFVIPNIFSPNGDGINDVWRVTTTLDITIENFVIYNRWGVSIFKSEIKNLSSKIITWDGYTTSGIASSDGVYYYVLEVKNEKDELKKFRGIITLLR